MTAASTTFLMPTVDRPRLAEDWVPDYYTKRGESKKCRIPSLSCLEVGAAVAHNRLVRTVRGSTTINRRGDNLQGRLGIATAHSLTVIACINRELLGPQGEQSIIRICQLGNAGELPEEVVKPRRAVVKDRGVRVSPRALQVESHREGIPGAGFRAWYANAERRLEMAVAEMGRNRSELSRLFGCHHRHPAGPPCEAAAEARSHDL
jgi:hypothetical protein